MADGRPRSRLHRDPRLVALEPQTRDLAVLRDLFYFRWATAPALALTASWANGGEGHAYFPKRLTQLWRAGYVERFQAGFSRYLHGSRPFVYTIADGRASAAARTGLHPLAIPNDRWRQVLVAAAPARDRTREALRAAGIAPRETDRVLHNNGDAAMKHYAGDSSGVRHHLLSTELVSLLWYSARAHGWPVEDIEPDGVADLSFRDPEPQRHRDLITGDGIVPIRPDCMFTIAGHRFAIEAETGSASTAKLRLKLRRYARFCEVCRNPALRVIIHSGADAHVDAALTVIGADVPRTVRQHFICTRSSVVVSLMRTLDTAADALTDASSFVSMDSVRATPTPLFVEIA